MSAHNLDPAELFSVGSEMFHGDEGRIATIEGEEGDVMEARLALFKASPVLLEALKNVIEVCYMPKSFAGMRRLRAAEAAVAEAEGRGA